jgi:hypothetical protein
MHRSTTWRRVAVAALGSAALAVTGLQSPAAAVVTAGDEVCLTPAQDAPGSAVARAAGGTVDRALDHAPVSAVEQARIATRTERLLAGGRGSAATQTITIPVRVHVMRADDGVTGDVTDEQIADQIAVLNATYGGDEDEAAANTGFRFVLKSTDRYDNSQWHEDLQSRKYRAETRLGTKRALNVWLVEFDYLGIATFPWALERNGAVDGVRVHFDSLPGGSLAQYNLGKTATHEVGHWLGLYHTFQGGCAKPGDEVKDTPAQALPTEGCPPKADTCPGKPGLDPIHNYMDYSYDSCYSQFTADQKSRMRQLWRAYRA